MDVNILEAFQLERTETIKLVFHWMKKNNLVLSLLFQWRQCPVKSVCVLIGKNPPYARVSIVVHSYEYFLNIKNNLYWTVQYRRVSSISITIFCDNCLKKYHFSSYLFGKRPFPDLVYKVVLPFISCNDIITFLTIPTTRIIKILFFLFLTQIKQRLSGPEKLFYSNQELDFLHKYDKK